MASSRHPRSGRALVLYSPPQLYHKQNELTRNQLGQGQTLCSSCHAWQESKLCHLQPLNAAMYLPDQNPNAANGVDRRGTAIPQIRRGTASQSYIQRHIWVLPGQAWDQQSRAVWATDSSLCSYSPSTGVGDSKTTMGQTQRSKM